jgi:hypothetical protein
VGVGVCAALSTLTVGLSILARELDACLWCVGACQDETGIPCKEENHRSYCSVNLLYYTLIGPSFSTIKTYFLHHRLPKVISD